MTTHNPGPASPSYSFDNNDPEAVDRHRHLAAILDGPTIERLTGLGDLTGRRCWELGAGGGSVARWLAERTGPTGRVLATDLNPVHLAADQGYELRQHDVVLDALPEGGPWDLIHARLVLLHIPERHEVLRKLAGALAPGGALVVEDFYTAVTDLVLAAPDRASAELFNRFQETLIGEILPANGNDPSWAARVHAEMVDAGLVDVDTVVHARSWPGGTPGALIAGTNFQQVSGDLLARGFSQSELDTVLRLVADPRLVLRSNLTYSTAGRRPETGQ